MIRAVLLMLAISAGLYAQAQNPVITEAKQLYTSYETNLIKAAEKMPEADYNFKPTPEMRTWGELMLHIAGTQYRYCAMAKGGEVKTPDLNVTKKADIVSALKGSFDFCDSVWNSLTTATAFEMVPFGRGGNRSRLGALLSNSQHNAEEYGYAAPYMRLRGVIPPSSEAAPAAPAPKK